MFLEDWKALPIGEYPLTADSPEWKEMDYCEALDACNMPLEYAKSLTTEELVKYAVNYPLITDILLFNSLKDGIDSLERKSTVFQELFSRPDHKDELLKEYQNMSCDYALLQESHDMEKSNYLKEIFLEAYFGVNYDELSEVQADEVVQEYGRKYGERPEELQDYSTAKIFYQGMTESSDLIPEEAIPSSLEDDIEFDDKGASSGSKFTKTISYLVGGPYGSVCYYGYKYMKGKKVMCYKFHAVDYTTAEAAKIDSEIASDHPTFEKVRGATKRYNCHSYAWCSTKETNPLWINDPSNIYTNNPTYFKALSPSSKLAAGDKMLFFKGSALQHSAILTSATRCRSKLGSAGVYKTTIKEMKNMYGTTTSSYRKLY